VGVVEDSPASEVAQTADSRVGSLFGPYRLNRLLGSGGFGEVYEAEDTTMNRVVALKLLTTTYSDNSVFRERLFREAHTAGRLREPHVLPIHNCGEIDGQVYIDMRLVRGVDLETVLQREGRLEPARAVAIVRQIAAALDAAHAENVIHRDVKPANILLADGDFASLVDFGLANAAGDARLTKPGKAVGTFDYVAPERLTNAPVDHRCDVYALACVFYEFLTGVPPYGEHRDLPALMTAHISALIPLPSQKRPGLPPGFDEVIARGLAKNPDHRYPSAGALAAAAQQALNAGEPDPASTPPPKPQPTEPPPMVTPHPGLFESPARGKSRRRNVIAVAAIALVAAVVAGVVWIVNRPDSAANQAESAPRPSSANPTTLPFPPLPGAKGVAVDAEGSVYAVVTGLHAPDGQILKLPPGKTSTTELPFGEIFGNGVAVDGEGNVYSADLHSHGVWKLAPGARGPSLLPFGQLLNPVGVAVGKDDTVYALDEGAGQVLKLPAGATSPSGVMSTTVLNGPQGIAVDKDGGVYVTDTEARRVLKLAVGAQTPTELPFAGLARPWGVAVDKDGNVYVSDPDPHRVLKLAAGATASTEVHFPGLDSVLGIAVNKDGDLFVVNCHKSDNCAMGMVMALGVGS
jgi:serine/threonine protein kinase, bacterial